MYHFLLVINKQGKVRIAKFFSRGGENPTSVTYTPEEKINLQDKIYRLITSRSSKFTNFIELEDYKIVYKRYAGLYFCFGIDPEDNVLATTEIIHLFVEVLDQYFGNACELDLVFQFYKVFSLLDELIIGGEVIECSKPKILKRLFEQDKLP